MHEIKQFVGFELNAVHYGVDIMVVEEIIRLVDTTPVPRAPAFVKGIVNIRDWVFPVVDLSKKLGLRENPITEETRIIIVSTNNKRVGLLVDKVEEVIRVNIEDIDIAPGTSHISQSYVAGIAKTKKAMVILLEVMNIFSPDERATLALLNKK